MSANLYRVMAVSLSALCLVSPLLHASEKTSRMDELLAMDLRNLLEVEIATGTPVSIDQAPAVASVITALDIKSMGARNLLEVLNTVPGLQVDRSSQSMSPKFYFRGIVSTYTPQTLLMVNGVSLKSLVRGDNHIFWGEFPIHAISRIEIIRGPHSALYGANAFSGVINVITKTADEVKESLIGASAGSFDRYGMWLNHAVEMEDWSIALNAEYVQSDGYTGRIESDAQTVIDRVGDQLFAAGILPFDPADASLAPGGLNMQHKSLDVWISASHPRVKLDAGIQRRWQLGSGQGAAEALDPVARLGGYRHVLQVSVLPVEIAEQLSVEFKAHYYGSSQRTEEAYRLLPPGTLFGSFPDGLIGQPETHEYTAKVESEFAYSGWDDHQLLFGIGYDKQDLYKITDKTNFNPDLTPRPEGQVEVTDTPDIFLPEATRSNRYLFVQDIYQIDKDLNLTAGFRFDDYSDFGSTFNPRLALVWSIRDNVSAKFLYGRAFRAPSFAETLVTANPIALGNPQLSPEVIDTYELALNYRSSQNWELNTSVFKYFIEDFITFVPDPGATTATAQNLGKRTGFGVETELNYAVHPDWILRANYAYVRATDDIADEAVGDYPEHKAYARLNWSMSERLTAHMQVMYLGKRKRAPGDIRQPLDGYTAIDIGIRYLMSDDNLELELIARNALDEDVRAPSQGSTDNGSTPANIEHDLPQAGRSLTIRLSKLF